MFRATDELGEHGRDAVRQILSLKDLVRRRQSIDLDAVKSDDEFLRFSKRDFVCSRSGSTSLSHTFADVEWDAARGPPLSDCEDLLHLEETPRRCGGPGGRAPKHSGTRQVCEGRFASAFPPCSAPFSLLVPTTGSLSLVAVTVDRDRRP